MKLIKNKKNITKKNISKKKRESQTIKFSPEIDYQEELMHFLKDPENAAAYLNTALEESRKGDEESRLLFLRALKNIADAQGTISGLAQRANVRRESIHRALSARGNPHLQTVANILGAMGFGVKIYPTAH